MTKLTKKEKENLVAVYLDPELEDEESAKILLEEMGVDVKEIEKKAKKFLAKMEKRKYSNK